MPFSGIALAFWLIAVPQTQFDQTVTPWTLAQWRTAEGMNQDGKSNLGIALQAAGLELEILDQRELHYYFRKPEEFMTDLRAVRNRYKDLEGAPSLESAVLFPSNIESSDLLVFNREYRQYLGKTQSVWGNRKEIVEAIAETDALYEIWDAAKDANTNYYYSHIRRQALKKLKEMLGDEDFEMGRMPPHVPVWRFNVIR